VNAEFYTLASWHVQEDSTEEFIRLWGEELAPVFMKLNPTGMGTLIQSLDDPQQFYSFGPWGSVEQMQAALANPQVRAAIGKLMAVCDEAKPGPFRLILTVP
jgi:hypothetical protein